MTEIKDGHDVVFPARGRQTFDGGLNTKYERTLIADNESPDCLNVVFRNAAAGTRGGTSKLNTTAIGSYAIDGIYTRRDNTGAETMIVFAGGTAWNLTGTSTFATIGSGQSVFTAGQRVGTAQYENHMFIGNGGVTPYKWNGTAFTRHGVPAATGVVSAACITTSTGALNGEYRYRIAYVNSQSVAGDVGTATVTLSVTNGKIHLTDIPTAPQSHGVSSRRIYRNFASGATATYGLLATLSDNTTTLYVDNTTDASLGATYGTDQGEPPKYNAIVQHQNRLFCNDPANPNYIWYSNINEPYTFASTNFQPVGDASLDLVKGLAVYDNGIVITCERYCYLYVMPTTSASDWYVVKIRSPYGSKSPYGMFLYDNKLMIPAMDNDKFIGFASVSGGTIDADATFLDTVKAGSDRRSDRIEDEMFDVAEASVGQISAITYKNKAYISVPSGSGQTTNNRIFIFDYSISNLSKKQEASWVPVTGLSASQFTIYGANLYYGSSTANGFVYQMETANYNDDSSAINSYFWTKEFSGLPGHENLEKDFRKAYILVEKAGSYYMNIQYRVNSDSGEGITKQIDLSSDTGTWGTDRWGIMIWGAGDSQEEVVVPLGSTTGKRIQFKFSNQNTANQRFQVLGLNFSYNLKGRR